MGYCEYCGKLDGHESWCQAPKETSLTQDTSTTNRDGVIAELQRQTVELRARVRGLLNDLDYQKAQVKDTRAGIRRLRLALGDAIRRPMGVVPDSAGEFYDDRNGRVKP